jgi:hypothetical protein
MEVQLAIFMTSSHFFPLRVSLRFGNKCHTGLTKGNKGGGGQTKQSE